MKMLLFSDLHLRPESEEVCFKVLYDLIKEVLANDCKHIYFLGDFWHLRYSVPVHLLNDVHEWITACDADDIHVSLLTGNHDQINVEGHHALRSFEEHCNAQVFDRGVCVGPQMSNTYFIPYIKDHSRFMNHVSNIPEGSVLFTHMPVFGAMMNNLMPDQFGLPIEAFSKFKRIISGHYHKPQTIGNFTYLGSPWQTRADEYGQEKGFSIYDTETDELTFHPRIWGKRYHKVHSIEEINDTFSKDDRITVVGGTKKDRELLESQGFTDVVLDNKKPMSIVNRVTATQSTTLSDYARMYVEDKAGDLDKLKLISIFEENR